MFLKIKFFILGIAFLATCSQQNGTITGSVAPQTNGAQVCAAGKSQQISSASVRADGQFTMKVPAGTYEVRISVPGNNYPVVFPGVIVLPGKTTALGSIALPKAVSETSQVSGMIFPARANTRVALLQNGVERAEVLTDASGKYFFSHLPPGNYHVQASAPRYSPDTIEITLSEGGTATQDLNLLYISSVTGVDWDAGKIRVAGFGAPPANAGNTAVARAMAERAALADAERKLAEAIAKIRMSPDQTLKERMGSRNFTQRMQGFIQGYVIKGKHELPGGRIKLDVELPLSGQNGLSRSLSR